MIQATSLKSGAAFLFEGKPYVVIKYTHIKVGRGGAIVRVTARNLQTGSTEEKTFSSNVSLEEINTFKRKLQYLYKDATVAYLMDPKTFEQVEVSLSVLGDQISYMNDGEEFSVLYWDQVPLSIELPPSVILEVTDADPGVKGNSATNLYKQAVLKNGLKVKVPLFINIGDKIKVDTRTGDYVERVK